MAMIYYYAKSQGFYSQDNYKYMEDQELKYIALEISLLADIGVSINEIIDYIEEKYRGQLAIGLWGLEQKGNLIIVEDSITEDKIKVVCYIDLEFAKMLFATYKLLNGKKFFEIWYRGNPKSEYKKKKVVREGLIDVLRFIFIAVMDRDDWDLEDKFVWESKDGEIKIILKFKVYESRGLGYIEIILREDKEIN
jgi:hypothetical protein